MNNNNGFSNNIINLNVAQSGTDFVGIKISNKEKEIIYPMGYEIPQKTIKLNEFGKNEKKQIINLIKCINICSSNKKGETISKINGEITNEFPIKSIFFIIEDYLERNSYYTEREILYTKKINGKISWPRTIKNIKPAISDSGMAFLSFIIRKNNIQENQLITELHKYCVYKCFELFGFLYTALLPEKGLLNEKEITKNKQYYISFLQEKIDSTNNDNNLELFQNMLFFLNNYNSQDETKEACYGTNTFQVVWEYMLNSLLGNISQKIKEQLFYPCSRWTFIDGKSKVNHPLRPDTIMLKNQQCYIIDAKYYSYTMLREIIIEEDKQESILVHGSIPGTDSIQKQITYAQYLDEDIKNYQSEKRKNYRFNHKNIFNVFIIPAENSDEIIKYIGTGTSDWNDGSKNYHYIHLLSMNTKFLLDNYKTSNNEVQNRVINLINKYSIK